MQRRLALRRKFKSNTLRSLTSSVSAKKNAMIMDAFLSIYKLKLKLEAIEREYSNLMAIKRVYLNQMKHSHVPNEVKVEKYGKGFTVKVKCEKGEDRLVSVLEAFEEMGLNVMDARVSCNNLFSMEAIAMADDQDQALDVKDVTQALILAIENKSAGTKETFENHIAVKDS